MASDPQTPSDAPKPTKRTSTKAAADTGGTDAKPKRGSRAKADGAADASQKPEKATGGKATGTKAAGGKAGAEKKAAGGKKAAGAAAKGSGRAKKSDGASSDGAAQQGGGSREVSQEDISRRAFEIYQQRGGVHGRHEDDWRQAEQELRGKR